MATEAAPGAWRTHRDRVPDEVREAAATIAGWGGGTVAGVVFFGSHRTRAAPDTWSAHDFFVVADAYPAFYRSLRSAAGGGRRAWLLAALNAVLPPNQLALRLPGGRLAKCAVVSSRALARDTGPARRDHFCAGRLFQPVAIAWVRDSAAREALDAALDSAIRATFEWVRPWLPETFDAAEYGRTALRVSMSWEIRPEPSGRADALWHAQREELEPALAALLDGLAQAGELSSLAAGRFRLVRPVTGAERFRTSWYFRVSLVRATLRWAKYVWTFDGWLDYILRKARRHSGQDLELTPEERRFPLLLLWPRVVRYLRGKDDPPCGPDGP